MVERNQVIKLTDTHIAVHRDGTRFGLDSEEAMTDYINSLAFQQWVEYVITEEVTYEVVYTQNEWTLVLS